MRPEAPKRRGMFTLNSQDLDDVVFNDSSFIKDDFIPEGDGQVASGSESLPDPVDLETDEQMLEREQNERDVLDTLDEYKCDVCQRRNVCGGCVCDC